MSDFGCSRSRARYAATIDWGKKMHLAAAKLSKPVNAMSKQFEPRKEREREKEISWSAICRDPAFLSCRPRQTIARYIANLRTYE